MLAMPEAGCDPDALMFSASTIDLQQKALNTLQCHGVVLVRNAISATLAADLQRDVEEWYRTSADAFQIENGVSGGHLRSPIEPLLNQVALSIFRPVAIEFLQSESIVVPVNHLLFRQRDDNVDKIYEERGTRHIFHQDHGLIPEAFPLNCWIALSDVDAARHGLSFALPCPRGPVNEDARHYVESRNGMFWEPSMSPGDMLIFHRFTIHGSWIAQGKPQARYSVEFRCGDLKSSPAEYASALWHLAPPHGETAS